MHEVDGQLQGQLRQIATHAAAAQQMVNELGAGPPKTYEDGLREGRKVGYETALNRLIEVADVTERRETPVIKHAAHIVRMMGHDFGAEQLPALPL